MKFGRLPGKIPVGLHFIGHYAAGSLPKPPAKVAVPSVAWQMLGNDEYGDCGVAGLEHGFMAAAADVSKKEAFADDQQAVSYYLKYNRGADQGVVLSDFLAYVRRNGYYGEKVSGYAPVAVHDIPTLQFAVNAYDFAYVGITVSQGMMNACQAPSGWTWTAEDLFGGPVGGHCIIIAGYDSQWLYGVTWGQVIRIAYPAFHAMTDEAWAVITGEVSGGDGHGLNLAALQADLAELAR